jgi:hypothetical protein
MQIHHKFFVYQIKHVMWTVTQIGIQYIILEKDCYMQTAFSLP